ncbi:hypothetical protein BDV29DRAFT_176548 [Aspergillus leporis]|uniref:Uncharacterized protein n=1 Tax=Aspergillus leporis TaxID=41062 RepID=A0A5N5X0M9_9EURO|nr:hypothetical protein BDV29DRAFT_176548 [Aspergillus leporis]
MNAFTVTGSTSGKHWFSTADHPSRDQPRPFFIYHIFFAYSILFHTRACASATA